MKRYRVGTIFFLRVTQLFFFFFLSFFFPGGDSKCEIKQFNPNSGSGLMTPPLLPVSGSFNLRLSKSLD